MPEWNITSPYMSTPESTPTHLPWGNPMPEPYAKVDFIPQSGTFDLGPFRAKIRIGACLKKVHKLQLFYVSRKIIP